jgi:O-antigen ligase
MVEKENKRERWRDLKLDQILLLLALFSIPFDRYFLIYQPSEHSPGTTLGKVLVALLLMFWVTKVVFVGNFRPVVITLSSSVCVTGIFFLWSSYISTMNSRNLAATAALMIPRINLVIFLILMINIIRSWSFLKKCMLVLMIASVFVCLAGFYELVTQEPVLESTYTLSQARTTLPQLETGSYRVQGFGGDPDYHGAMLVSLAGMLLFYVFRPGKWIPRILAALLFGAYVINIIATGSRSVWVGFMTLLGAFFLFAQIRYKWVIAGISAFSIIVVFGILAFTTDFATTERFTTLDLNDPAIRSRIGDFYMGAKMIEDHPFLGIGVGNFFAQYYRYSHMVSGTMSPKWRPKQAQNGFIQVSAEQGIIGLIIYLLLFLMVLREIYIALRRKPKAEDHLLIVGLLTCFCGLIGLSMFIPMTQQEPTWIIFAFSSAAARLFLEKHRQTQASLPAAQ